MNIVQTYNPVWQSWENAGEFKITNDAINTAQKNKLPARVVMDTSYGISTKPVGKQVIYSNKAALFIKHHALYKERD